MNLVASGLLTVLVALVQPVVMSQATPTAHADVVAYLVNVTVRPGYKFPDADAAIAYGLDECDKVAQGRSYADVIGDIKADFNTSNDFQVSHLLTQLVGELCPAPIWQLCKSAANYRLAA